MHASLRIGGLTAGLLWICLGILYANDVAYGETRVPYFGRVGRLMAKFYWQRSTVIKRERDSCNKNRSVIIIIIIIATTT